MAARGTVTIKILGDNKNLSRALNDSESKLGRFASGAGKLFKAGAVGIGALGAGALIVGPQVLEAGAKLEALGIKSATVFGDSLGDVQKWADGVAGSMGLTSAALTGAAAGLGDLLKPMGFTSAEAAKMSSEMLDLSGALSAWSGGQRDATEVADILAKAMLGETDGLKGLGISISAAEIEARLLAKGQKELTGTALAQAKALATQELIMEKSTDAQAAWTDGSMDSIKAQNESKASIAQLKEQFVQGLYPAIQAVLPVLTKAATWLGEHLPAAFAFAQAAGERITSWFEANWPTIQATIASFVDWFQANALPVIRGVIDAVLVAFDAVAAWTEEHWPAIRETIVSTLGAIQVVVTTVVGTIQALWRTFGETITTYAKAAWDTVSSLIGAAMNVIQGVINTVTALIRGDWSAAWDGIKQTVSGVWDGIKALVQGAIDTVKAAVSGGMDAVKASWSAIWGSLGGFVSSAATAIGNAIRPILNFIQNIIDKANAARNAIANINPLGGNTVSLAGNVVGGLSGLPKNHSGGIVGAPGTRTDEVLTILQRGEGVIDRDTMRRGVSGGGDVQRSSVVINLMDQYQVEAVVSQRDADLLMSLEAGMR